MAASLQVERFGEPLAERLADPRSAPRPGEVLLYWLGQAGFVIEAAGLRLLIDPYLSDSLARKYRGTRYTHVRMMAAPIRPEQFTRLDLVLCTHRHTDHMDPETLQPLAARFPALRFVVPAAEMVEARARCGVGDERLLPARVGEALEALPGLRVEPLPAAHETLALDALGQHHWLGYCLTLAGLRLYHSGDCVPYAGQPQAVARCAPDLALLPVNGRDPARSSQGVPGNFSLDEAIELSRAAQVPVMIAHHHGLFDFNTVAPEVMDARAAEVCGHGLNLQRARLGCAWRVTTTHPTETETTWT